MKLLILENEVYLAQSIAGKLNDVGYECTISQSVPTEPVSYHAILISSNIYSPACESFIKQNAHSIIIMMISYISDDTVSKPMLAGAKDYVLKPFMIDELVRKLHHYREFVEMQKTLDFYSAYFNFVEKELNTPSLLQYNPPFIIKSTSQRSADVYAMKYAREKNLAFDFITLKTQGHKDIFKHPPKHPSRTNKIYYITNLEELKKQDRKEFLDIACKYPVIISCISADKISFPQVIDISHIPNTQELGGEIMSLQDYVKTIIAKFEHRYPDVELAKKLGMSRKSLWEKRKKYGLLRKKQETH